MLAAKHRHEMPTGPKGQKRVADVASNAVRVMQIATGQIEESTPPVDGKNQAAAALGRLGGKARAQSLSKKARSQIAKKAAKARWV
ncbi:MAG: hypothetical protein Q8N18_19390 [Opitutaceae bacterium]|nr:hypothetical protein [Opitutaceae bacterium]